jgi:riboflavin transporter FmnP
MFYRTLFDGIGPLSPLVVMVNEMNAASIILFVVPALLVLIGLRRHYWVALAVLALTLLVVGVTMYAGSPLNVHLGAIFVAVVALVGHVALFVIPPWQRASQP